MGIKVIQLLLSKQKLKRSFFLFVVIFACCFFSGCGFKQPSASDIPTELRVLYIDSLNPYSLLTIQLSRMLTSLNVHITRTEKTAPLILRIFDTRLSYDIPPITYSGNAASYNYTLTTSFELVMRNGKRILGPNELSVSQSLLQNTNQVYAPNATTLMKRELTPLLVTAIYNQLANQQIRALLRKTFARKQIK